MSDIRSPRDPDPAPETDPHHAASTPSSRRSGSSGLQPFPLPPLLPRRPSPWLVVEVDGSAASHGALVWALREAARRDATVVATSVLDTPEGDPLEGSARVGVSAQLAAYNQLEARVLRAIGETGIHGRVRTAVLDRPVFEALTAATQGADLVMVGARGKTLLRQAVPRPHARRLARGA